MRRITAATIMSLVTLPVAATDGVARAPLPKSESECVAAGGNWVALGLPFITCGTREQPRPCENVAKSCLLKTADAGKQCTDSSQCESLCIAPDKMNSDIVNVGSCASERPLLGVRELVEGKVVRVTRE